MQITLGYNGESAEFSSDYFRDINGSPTEIFWNLWKYSSENKKILRSHGFAPFPDKDGFWRLGEISSKPVK
ncbi:MAG: hypothetical protein SFY92_00560 [Verrucomicrobiae bacterium]|nr:hypothetical protein [Verrucomicrobiae bacterium]